MSKYKKLFSILSLLVVSAGLFVGTRLVQRAKDIREGTASEQPLSVSGIYPSLALFGHPDNFHAGLNEAGIGAVGYKDGKMWTITYPSHSWQGSKDYLWEINLSTKTKTQRTTESVGGTHAGRAIVDNKLLIGPYIITSSSSIKTISPSQLPGRITAITKHLSNSNKAYYYTMEQGLYEVNVDTAQVTNVLHQDANKANGASTNCIASPLISGAHGKGAYVGQGKLFLANNGKDPCSQTPGTLAHCSSNCSNSSNWTEVHHTNFNEISGPGGLNGNQNGTDPIWAIGWDNKSNILKVHDSGTWKTFRFPMTTHSYSSATGWHTEWPRIHRLGFPNYPTVMDMFGMFYKIPTNFTTSSLTGISPIASHLSYVNDIMNYNDNDQTLVFAHNDLLDRDDKHADEILKPQSNFRFTNGFGSFGPARGVGSVWLKQNISGQTTSQLFHLGGYDKKIVHFSHNTAGAAIILSQIYSDGQWSDYKSVQIPPSGYGYLIVPPEVKGDWIRFRTPANVESLSVSVWYEPYASYNNPTIFSSLVQSLNEPRSFAVLRPKDETLQFVKFNLDANGNPINKVLYEVDDNLNITQVSNATDRDFIANNLRVSDNRTETVNRATYKWYEDDSSAIVEENGTKFRLPRSTQTNDYDVKWKTGWARFVRYFSNNLVMNIHGTFYDLPDVASGGVRKIKPISTHNRLISDFYSWRGMFVLSGLQRNAPPDGHLFKAETGEGLWFGSIDDLWKFPSPSGKGGPWLNKTVSANSYSTPYLMGGYAKKVLRLTNSHSSDVKFTVDVDPIGDNNWKTYSNFFVGAGKTLTHNFPEGYSAQWIRFKTDKSANVSAQLTYTAENDASIGYCLQNDWSQRQSDFPNPGTSYRSFKHSIHPNGNLQQSVISSDGKTLYYRQLNWANDRWNLIYNYRSWSDWPDPGLSYYDVSQVSFPDGRLKETALRDNGRTLWVRYLQWDGAGWSSIGPWNERSTDLPNNTEVFRSFDETILSDGTLLQTAHAINSGDRIFSRKLEWNSTTKSWTLLNSWQVSYDEVSGLGKDFTTYDLVLFPDGRLKKSVITDGGTTLAWQYHAWDTGTTCHTAPPTPIPTHTPIPTSAATSTPIPPTPTNTPVPTATNTPVPTATSLSTPSIPGDINSDGVVSILDYILLSNAFGTRDVDADINQDGIVSILDYIILSNNFGRTSG